MGTLEVGTRAKKRKKGTEVRAWGGRQRGGERECSSQTKDSNMALTTQICSCRYSNRKVTERREEKLIYLFFLVVEKSHPTPF